MPVAGQAVRFSVVIFFPKKGDDVRPLIDCVNQVSRSNLQPIPFHPGYVGIFPRGELEHLSEH